MGRFHHLAGLGLLRDFEHQGTDDEALAFARYGYAFDEEIGASRDPRELNAELAAGGVLALSEHDGHLASGPLASGVPIDAIGDPHDGF